MKVLHLISGGDTGGAKTHMLTLFKGFENILKGTIVCFMEGVFYQEAKDQGIDIRVIAQKNRMDLSIVDKIADLAKEGEYDIIHCHGARANFVALFLRKKINIPMISTVHSDYELDFKDNIYKRLIFTNLNKFALKRFKYFIAVSRSFKEMLIDRGFSRDNIFVSYNGIDVYEKRNFIDKKDFLNRYNIEDDKGIIVGILARLDKVKDHKTFIKMAKEVDNHGHNIKFLIGGDGHELNELKSLSKELKIDERVYFLGNVKDPFSFFNAIDINTLSSVSESFPYAILEGAVMKKPLVSTRVGGLVDLINDGENGYLVDVSDYKSMSERVLKLALDNNLRYKMGENLYEKVKSDFSAESMAKTHLDIYNEILSREKRAR